MCAIDYFRLFLFFQSIQPTSVQFQSVSSSIFIANSEAFFSTIADPSNLFAMPPANQPNPFIVREKRNSSPDVFLTLFFPEHCSATVSGSAVSQSVRQATRQLDEFVSLILIQSNKAPRFEASSINKFIFLSPFAFSFLRTSPETHSSLVIRNGTRKDHSDIRHSETALSFSIRGVLALLFRRVLCLCLRMSNQPLGHVSNVCD